MKLAAVDLNLLVALDAVFSERNVTRAAAQIGRSQPATSHALNRARALFGDALLVRAGGTLELTARARGLAPQIRRLLKELGAMFDAQQASNSRGFRRGSMLARMNVRCCGALTLFYNTARENQPRRQRARSTAQSDGTAPDQELQSHSGLVTAAGCEERALCVVRSAPLL